MVSMAQKSLSRSGPRQPSGMPISRAATGPPEFPATSTSPIRSLFSTCRGKAIFAKQPEAFENHPQTKMSNSSNFITFVTIKLWQK
jgi:hypothetical protein